MTNRRHLARRSAVLLFALLASASSACVFPKTGNTDGPSTSSTTPPTVGSLKPKTIHSTASSTTPPTVEPVKPKTIKPELFWAPPAGDPRVD